MDRRRILRMYFFSLLNEEHILFKEIYFSVVAAKYSLMSATGK